MHILWVAHSYPRWDGDVAGAFIERLVGAITARGHSGTVVVPADEGKGGPTEQDDRIVRRVRYAPARWEVLAYRGTMVNQARSLTGFAALASLIVALARAIRADARATSADVVHAHWWAPAGIAAWLARARGGPPYVVTLHGTDVAILHRSAWARRIARRVFERAAAVTAVSGYLAEQAALSTGFPRERIAVQPMPVDVDRFQRHSDGGGGVVTVGRLVPQKRIEVVIDAVAKLKQGGRRVPLTIVGDGTQRRALEERARASGIADSTRFVGWVAPESIADAINDADVFVFTAEREGFGLAVVEALMAGVPVVATRDGGGAVEAVPANGAGTLVDATDLDQVAASIAALTPNAQSLRLARDAGRVLKQQLHPDRVAEVFEAIYRRAANSGPKQ